MNIGEAAAASGVSAKMIRYYESIGLIEPAARSSANYRVYGGDDVHTLRFIRRARRLGFSVEETEQLLGLWRDSSRASSEVKAIADNHIGELERKITELEEMAATLRHLAASCAGDKRPHCPILNGLAGGDGQRHADHGPPVASRSAPRARSA
jgi:MerR family transcriptional regulator, copper efflux regulator